jgi:hypothetical protein
MGSATSMAILIGVLALILVGAFLAVWTRDRNRSHEQSGDPARTDTDPASRRREGRDH